MLKKYMFNIKEPHSAKKWDDDHVYLEMVRVRDTCFYENKTNYNNIFESSNVTLDNYTMYCPANFDGRMCWDATPAGGTVVQICPQYLVGPGVSKEVTRKCLDDGDWLARLDHIRPWPAYLECISENTVESYSIQDIFHSGFMKVLTCLLITSIMLTFFRILKHFKIQIHYKFLVALFIDNCFFALWYNAVVMNSEVRIDQMVISRSQCLAKCVCVIAWIMSSLFIVVHASKRIQESRQYPLWLTPTGNHWTYTMPIVIVMYLGIFYLIHVVTVVAARLLGSPAQSYIADYINVLSAPFVLMPLFGLHFLLVPFAPPQTDVVARYLNIFKSMLFSFLGTCFTFLMYNGLTIAMRHRFNRYRRFYYMCPLDGTCDCDYYYAREHEN